jgi:hypothetical protein
MHEFLTGYLVHVVAFATLISRLGDIGTTLLVSPDLKLEANPIAQRLGRRYIFATAGLALIPYYSIHAGIVVCTASFLAAAFNASEAMLARSMGEEKYATLNREAIQKTPVFLGLSLLCLPAFFLMAWGLLILVLFPDSSTGWGFDIAMGIMLFALGLFILYPIRFFSERRLPNAER